MCMTNVRFTTFRLFLNNLVIILDLLYIKNIKTVSM